MQFDSGGSKSKKMKLTVKGGAAVDPDSGKFVLHNRVIGTFSAARVVACPFPLCLTMLSTMLFALNSIDSLEEKKKKMSTLIRSGLENSAHVLEQSGKMYSATLGLVDIVRGTNSYYKLQLLEDDVQKRSVASPKPSPVCRRTAVTRLCGCIKGAVFHLPCCSVDLTLQAIHKTYLGGMSRMGGSAPMCYGP